MMPLNPTEAAVMKDALTAADARQAAANGARSGTAPGRAELLFGEYLYAMNTAIQANDDRGRAVNYFILMASIFMAAASQLKVANAAPIAWITLFSGLAFIGWMSFFKIVRLRQAWAESVLCMNRIKQYYFAAYADDAAFQRAFLWKSRTIPAPDRAWTISFFSALTITLVSAASLAAALAFGIREVLVATAVSPGGTSAAAALTPNLQFLLGLALTIGLALVQLAIYFRMLRPQPDADGDGGAADSHP